MARYVALLRGINVGGNNIIKMAALRACFEAQGFGEVETYIQSGNVIFESTERGAALEGRIEEALSATFAYRAAVVVRSRAQLSRIAAQAPEGFGSAPKVYRYDVLFLKSPLVASAALKEVPVRDGVDQVHPGTGVLYASRLIRKASQSRISRLASRPIYQRMTIRNWNTTTRLLRMMDPARS